MPHWTTSEHGNRVSKTRFIGQNRVSETRVASIWYCFVIGTINYIVWILLLVTHFGLPNLLLFFNKVFLFDKEPMSNLIQPHVHNIKWSPKMNQECMLYRFKRCRPSSHDKKSSMANYFNLFRSHFNYNFISLTFMLNSKLSCNALWG